ncbi:MAG TPA: hypothetical protein VK166_12140 [Chitinophagaceae bacterium]|nr:hypothetical protein [Chitinophagaceae bacterium]
MKRKSTVVFILALAFFSILKLTGCIGNNEKTIADGTSINPAGTSQPGSGPDTLLAVFSGDEVVGSLSLKAATMQSLRAAQPGSGSDTVVLYLAKRVCQPGSSGDTCYTLTSYSFR